jgi:K+-transporting ATPase KdpF subunit
MEESAMPSRLPHPASFQGKTALVAGACRGTGREAALALAEAGARVVLFDCPGEPETPEISRTALESLADRLRFQGAEVEVFWGDVRSEAVVSRMVAKTLTRFGTLDLLFVALPLPPAGLSWDPFDDRWDAMVDTHLKGAWQLAKWTAPEMVRQKRGTIVFDTSDAQADPTCLGGLAGLARSLDANLAVYGVRAQALPPNQPPPRLALLFSIFLTAIVRRISLESSSRRLTVAFLTGLSAVVVGALFLYLVFAMFRAEDL